ncbi:induced myeloid leukemia cell differentiation protein Mcl-1 homolog [Acanthaster planci]|uniref:Induced myeloid leukemia cell differentiation protein Mcl-1 homolog n=1 Tax=Acanthaster planci TaxID=133434 RepID=A0A8B7ZI14_ACAPL|nr:induced myeloid leukemia cell differentiation protein Mcl-1 homolog [Acanthaster planci]
MAETILNGVSPQKNSISKMFYNGNDSKNSPPSPTELNGNSLSPSKEAECRTICKRLSRDFITFKLQANAGRPPCKYTETLRRVGREVEERYAISLNGLVNNLQYDPKKHGAGKELFSVSLDAMFEEGAVNWGRVVMVYVFAARLAKYCEENANPEYVDEVVEVCGDYVSDKLTPWIVKQGGWDDFNESFKAKDWKEKATFNSLLVTGAVLGGLAALRFLTK